MLSCSWNLHRRCIEILWVDKKIPYHNNGTFTEDVLKCNWNKESNILHINGTFTEDVLKFEDEEVYEDEEAYGTFTEDVLKSIIVIS